ncbi:EAL domain-containing protein [Devosia sp. PTR5]|uniref:EAL domain-containing protein n=1 Tax=Devosia oryzisoli TaxID=2774138 RepID=A0A927IT51_9HYPH|nr:EAL domain-containing protein [Devosia oryzisoli]
MALIVIAVVAVLVDRQAQTLAENQMRAQTLAQISVIRAKLEGNISANVQLVRGLVSTLSTEPEMNQARFAALASNLFEEDSQLRSVAAAPDLVVRLTYPYEPNRTAIGLDYRNMPAQWGSIEEVIRTGRLVMAGPVDLVQGGQGFISRFPVYTGDGADRHLWGIVSAIVDVERLYADSGLLDPTLRLDISISSASAADGAGGRFFGPDLSATNPVVADVVLPAGAWRIAAVPYGGWQRDMGALLLLRGGIGLAGALIFLPFLMTARMASERHRHIEALGLREKALAQVTRRLNLALDASKIGVWEMDLTQNVEMWDERTHQLYGRVPDGALRKHADWLSAVHPEDRDRAEGAFRSMIGSGRYECDYRVLRPDGTVLHVRSMGALHREPGEPERVIGVNLDITADVRLAEDLRRANTLSEARNQALEEARVRIEHNALHDSLTGLPNRRYLDDILARNAEHGFHESGGIALLHIDLDRFKQINDTLGHAAGDAMLIHASQVLRQQCRDDDFIARIGGDEFVIVAEAGQTDAALSDLALRVVAEMRKPALHEGHECRFGVSVGLAVARGRDIDVRQLLINADIALYRAKDRGRNRLEFFSESLQAEVITAKRVADEILKGLEEGAFFPHYQPQFDARTHDLMGVEALARWSHPTRGLLAPDAFMTIAEDLNVVASLDRMILEKTLADLKRWDEQGLRVPRASVNVSLRRLDDEGLVASLRDLAIEPGRISFELVESIYLDERDGVVGWNIDQLKDLGIDIEIDDFGTGYASIVSLQKLRPNRLKIDRQLVTPIADDPAQRRLVSSIVDIGASMGIGIVAEGVETLEQAEILRDLGCDVLQGYAFARPMAPADLQQFLVARRADRGAIALNSPSVRRGA